MAIIKKTKTGKEIYSYLNSYPDQFKSQTEKEDTSYIKESLDYFSNKAYSEFVKNKETFVKNYDLVKGILRREDFYEEDNVKSFTEMLEDNLDLPQHVKHYSIMTSPINELTGELTKRPDVYKAKAFDEDSLSEELQFKTEILHNFIISSARQKILESADEEIPEEELEQRTMEDVQKELDDYTSTAEKWANHILKSAKQEYKIKELKEEGFRDMLISARPSFHIYEDNSKSGFNIEVLNPKNCWRLTSSNKKYTSDVSGRNKGAYAAGKLEVMELSEIIESFPELTKAEIDHLRKEAKDGEILNVDTSNIGTSKTGIETIQYDTYDPLLYQNRLLIEHAVLDEHGDAELNDFLGMSNTTYAHGDKFVVCTSYWVSKLKVGKLTYMDEMGQEQTTLVPETYKSGYMPGEINLEWGWVNQIYWGRKIGQTVYHMGPYKLLPYIPIIGMEFEGKNTEARSIVDLMKPFQTIYNVCMNQLYELLKKEIGVVGSVNIRRVPRVKDGDGEDDIDIWEMEARERGIMFDDDSPENTKSPITNQSVAKSIDLSRSSEIQSRYNLAVQAKNECWELIGMSRQRMANVSASETATATNTAMQQSFAQTEPIFVAFEYLMGQLYQAVIDASQYIASTKEESTVNYITSSGEASFIKVNGTDVAFRDLKVFLTNSAEDNQLFNEVRQLSQALLQNGGSLYDIIELYSTNSFRELKKKFRDVRDETLKREQQQQEVEQQQVQQQLAQQEAEKQQEAQTEQWKVENDNYQKQLDRLHEKELAIIKATGFGQVQNEDNNNDGVADALEISKIEAKRQEVLAQQKMKLQELLVKSNLEHRKLDVDIKNQANDLAIAKENSKGRNKSK